MAAKAKKISGFPEWLPQEKIIEDQLISEAKSIYESHGFISIETPAVELVETLTAKGVVNKEIYGLHRLAAEESEKKAELGLHFDLTVPFARYVATHFNDLVFPFRRYQLQKAWRGERPQKGRFREFYQFDADIVARDTLPISCDAEVVTLLTKCLQSFNIGTPQIFLNNRKLLVGYYEGLGISEEVAPSVISVIDKLDKIGVEGAEKLLFELSLDPDTISSILEFSSHTIQIKDFNSFAKKLEIKNTLMEEGVQELVGISDLLLPNVSQNVSVKLQIARGLDYYTGTIVESAIAEYPDFGSVGSGGRYDGLVSQYLSRNLPGVGVSLGISRIMDLVVRNKIRECSKQSQAEICIVVENEDNRPEILIIAEFLREHGYNTEVFYRAPKLGKQIENAAKKGIPHVFFPDKLFLEKVKNSDHKDTKAFEKSLKGEIKNLVSGEQRSIEGLKGLL